MAKFFHVSEKKLPPGLVLSPKGGNHVADDVEAILEARRPSSCTPRQYSVFLSETEDASKHGFQYDSGYLHFATPSEPFARRDNYWIGQLQMRLSARQSFRDQRDRSLDGLSNDELADRYWTEAQSSDPNWEIVSDTAKIESLVYDDPVIIRSGGLLGLLKNN